jgi:AcrB/AcrD/AcrF family
VLHPLLFIGDVVGRLFREFAIPLEGTILVSAVVSLTLVPMACASSNRWRKCGNAFYRLARYGFGRVIDGCAVVLRYVLDHQAATLLVAIGTVALTARLYIIILKGFFPVQDTGLIQGMPWTIASRRSPRSSLRTAIAPPTPHCSTSCGFRPVAACASSTYPLDALKIGTCAISAKWTGMVVVSPWKTRVKLRALMANASRVGLKSECSRVQFGRDRILPSSAMHVSPE